MNANEAMRKNVAGLKKQTEKLSTGYSINRAADNASGLAVSEKMRSQIRGLTQASANSNDAISLIQTAEGGLQETQDIMQRMRELAVQSANGTYTDEDRMQIQHEVDALKSEVDRIAESTEFNEKKLLDGSLSGKGGASEINFDSKAKISRNSSNDIAATAQSSKIDKAGTGTFNKRSANDVAENVKVELTYKDKNTGATNTLYLDLGKRTISADCGTDAATWKELAKTATTDDDYTSLTDALNATDLHDDYDFTISDDGDITATAKAGKEGESNFEFVGAKFSYSVKDTDYVLGGGAVTTTRGKDAAMTITTTTDAASDTIKNKFSVDGANFQIVKLGDNADEGYTAIYTTDGTTSGQEETIAKQLREHGIEASARSGGVATAGSLYIKKNTVSTEEGGLTFQIGANGVEDQRVTLGIENMSTTALGIKGVSVATQDKANAAINTIDEGLKKVSSQRAKLGALQNRLEHTVNSLNTANENLSAAESQIRDTDMASEMIKYTKSNILQQASQSMLAQANQQPQGVLQLLG
jgi:flagellin